MTLGKWGHPVEIWMVDGCIFLLVSSINTQPSSVYKLYWVNPLKQAYDIFDARCGNYAGIWGTKTA